LRKIQRPSLWKNLKVKVKVKVKVKKLKESSLSRKEKVFYKKGSAEIKRVGKIYFY
jgi:hypothetical protein